MYCCNVIAIYCLCKYKIDFCKRLLAIIIFCNANQLSFNAKLYAIILQVNNDK